MPTARAPRATLALTSAFAACLSFAASTADEIKALSLELNKSLPAQIDREKILQTTLAFQATLIFKYTFIDETVISSPRFSKEKYTAHLQNSLGQSTCTDAPSFDLLKRGASFNYLFVTKAGLKVIDYTLTREVCAEYLRAKGGMAPSMPR